MYKKFLEYYNNLNILTEESNYIKDNYILVPFNAIERLLDTFPNESFFNMNYKWLDISVGYGNFIVVLIEKLMNTLKNQIIDNDDRFKYIVENMIFISDKSEYYLSNLSNIFDKNLSINIINNYFSDNLNGKYDFIISKTYLKHKQISNEYHIFYEKLIKISGKKIGILIDKHNLNNNTIEIFNISSNNTIINLNKDFGKNNKLDYSLLSSEPYTKEDIFISKTNNIIIDSILSLDIEKIYTKRTKAYLKNKTERDSYNDTETDIFKYKHFVNSCGPYETPYRYLDYKIDETFYPKIYMSEFIGTAKNKNIGKIYLDIDGTVGLATDSSMCIYEDDVDKLRRLYSYLSSDIVKYFINKYCDSSHVNSTTRLLPDITIYNMEITDEFINEVFNLKSYRDIIKLQNKLDSLYPSDKVLKLFYENINSLLEKYSNLDIINITEYKIILSSNDNILTLE